MVREASDARSRHVDAAIAEYLQAIKSGAAPDVERFIAQNADIEIELREFLADYQVFGQAAREAGIDSSTNAAYLSTGRITSSTRVRVVAPQQFGKFELLEEIARGGMGVVYKARQATPSRIVALKMILAGQFASPADVERFYAEAHAAAALDHPDIVPIFEVGEHDGQHYFTMAFVEGQSLGQRLLGGSLPAKEAAQIIRDVAMAVEYAHQHGVVHRDLKPANILLESDGRVRVTDFGLAKRQADDSGLTRTGELLGTPSFMPPEQISDDPTQIGPASDVYSLGATLYALVTGRPPFQAASVVDTLRQVVEKEPVSPRELDATIPRDLETITLKCLEKPTAQRYACAQALADELNRFLGGRPITARPVGQSEYLWRWCRRNPAIAALSGALIAALLATIAILGVSNSRIRRESVARAQAIEAKDAALLTANEKERLQRRRLYAAQMNLAMQGWRAGEPNRVLELLEGQRPGVNDEDLRGFEWYYLWRLCHHGATTLASHKKAVTSVKFSPDGKQVASAGWDGTIRLWNVSTGTNVRTLVDPNSMFWEVAFSPDGNIVAGGGKTQCQTSFWEARTGTLIGRIPLPLSGIHFCANGTDVYGSIASPENGGKIRVWDFRTGQERRELLRNPIPGIVIGTFDEGKYVVALSGQHRSASSVSVLRSNTGELKLQIPVGSVANAALSDDGQKVAVGRHGHGIEIYDTNSGKLITELKHSAYSARVMDFAPDGKHLAVAFEDREVSVWDIDSQQLVMRHSLLDNVFSLDYSPDGEVLAVGSADGTVCLWNMLPVEESRILPGPNWDSIPWGIKDFSFSSDGRSVVAIRGADAVVWDYANSGPANQLPWKDARAISANGGQIFGPDGEHIAIWDLADRNSVARLDLEPDGWMRAAFSPRGDIVAIFWPWKSGSGCTLWDPTSASSREVSFPSKAHVLSVISTAFSPDGRYLAVACQFNRVFIWNLKTNEPPWEIVEPAANTVAVCLKFSADSTKLAMGTDRGAVSIWSVESATRLKSFRGSTERVKAIDFCPDGKTLAVGSGDMSVRLWDIASEQEKLTLSGHQAEVQAVKFSPDGDTLASLGRDGVLRIWEASVTPEARACSATDTAANIDYSTANEDADRATSPR